MHTLQEIVNNTITEFETLIPDKYLNKKELDKMVYKIAELHVPSEYDQIIHIALEDLHIAIQDPKPSPFKNDNPADMMKSNIYRHIITQLEEFAEHMTSRKLTEP